MCGHANFIPGVLCLVSSFFGLLLSLCFSKEGAYLSFRPVFCFGISDWVMHSECRDCYIMDPRTCMLEVFCLEKRNFALSIRQFLEICEKMDKKRECIILLFVACMIQSLVHVIFAT